MKIKSAIAEIFNRFREKAAIAKEKAVMTRNMALLTLSVALGVVQNADAAIITLAADFVLDNNTEGALIIEVDENTEDLDPDPNILFAGDGITDYIVLLGPNGARTDIFLAPDPIPSNPTKQGVFIQNAQGGGADAVSFVNATGAPSAINSGVNLDSFLITFGQSALFDTVDQTIVYTTLQNDFDNIALKDFSITLDGTKYRGDVTNFEVSAIADEAIAVPQLRVSASAGGSFEVQFESQSGVSYQLQRATVALDALSEEDWISLTHPDASASGDGASLTLSDVGAISAYDTAWYRVVAE